MFEAFAAAVLLGLTAGLCPICLFFALPFLPLMASRSKNLLTAIKAAAVFSAGIAAVFAPLGFAASFVVGLAGENSGGWMFLVVGIIAVIMGLLALRVVKVCYTKPRKQFSLQTFGVGSFGYGIWFGLVTLGRAAPLLISMLSIAAVNEPLVGAAALFIYAFFMGMPIVILTAFIGITGIKNLVAKHSRKLDGASGLLLLGIGGYYVWRFIAT